jgi:hypothetical protein
MGLGSFVRRLRGDRRAMPDPQSAEFQEVVQGSALPGSTEMGQPGWASAAAAPAPATPRPETPDSFFGVIGQAGAVTPESLVATGVPPESAQATAAALFRLQQAFAGGTHAIDVEGLQGLRDQMRATLREHGVDPDSGMAVDPSSIPGLQEALLCVLAEHGVDTSQYGA